MSQPGHKQAHALAETADVDARNSWLAAFVRLICAAFQTVQSFVEFFDEGLSQAYNAATGQARQLGWWHGM